MTLVFQIMRPGGYLLWTMRDGYQAKSQRFALMDAELNDITSSGQAEMVSWQGNLFLHTRDCVLPGGGPGHL